ncbi:MAG: hypothetical protein ACJ788_08385 [Ktedonobacteraceae bacterium]
MLTEELLVLDADAVLWRAARALLDVALQIEQRDEAYSWHGWHKQLMEAFLKQLPIRCSLVLGVWETGLDSDTTTGQEELWLGLVCEVVNGEVCSLRTFEALTEVGLKPVKQIEPGIEDVMEVMHLVKTHVAPVAWALFTDKATWDEWLFTEADDGKCIDKGKLLGKFARQGRCVIMGSQAAHSHH